MGGRVFSELLLAIKQVKEKKANENEKDKTKGESLILYTTSNCGSLVNIPTVLLITNSIEHVLHACGTKLLRWKDVLERLKQRRRRLVLVDRSEDIARKVWASRSTSIFGFQEKLISV